MGPTLFLLYILDIVNRCDFQMGLFVDDALIYRVIKFLSDHDALQNDLNNLKSWADNWKMTLMTFNIAKSHLLSVTNWRKGNVRNYSIDSQELLSVATHDYLGWNSYCSKAASKASRMHRLIRRTLKLCCSDVKELAHLSMARHIQAYISYPAYRRVCDSRLAFTQLRML